MYHYNDRFYEASCETCNAEFQALSIREMKTIEEFHECGNGSVVISNDENYLVEFTPTAEFTKPMFTTNRY